MTIRLPALFVIVSLEVEYDGNGNDTASSPTGSVSARRYRKGVTESRRMTGSLELTGVRGTDRPTAGTRSERVLVVIGYFVLLTTLFFAVFS